MRLTRGLLLYGITFVLLSCSGGLKNSEFIEWVQDYDNGLHVRKSSGGFVFDLQYQPAEYVCLLRGETNIEQAKMELQDMQYYVLTIGMEDPSVDLINHDIQNISEKQHKQYYFSYLFQQDILLEDNGVTLPCVLFHFERPADVKRSRTFVLGFENPHKHSKRAKLMINSSKFGSLPIKLNVIKENIPSLKV